MPVLPTHSNVQYFIGNECLYPSIQFNFTQTFTAFSSFSSFETPDCVFPLSWIAIIVVVKARAGVVVSPQAMEHGIFYGVW